MRVTILTYSDFKDSTRGVHFEPTKVKGEDGSVTIVGTAEVTDEAALAYYRTHPSFRVDEPAAAPAARVAPPASAGSGSKRK